MESGGGVWMGERQWDGECTLQELIPEEGMSSSSDDVECGGTGSTEVDICNKRRQPSPRICSQKKN